MARIYGGRVIITEMMARKIERARMLGFKDVVDVSAKDPVKAVMELTDGKGADVVILAVGATSANSQALEVVKRSRGRYCFCSRIPGAETDDQLKSDTLQEDGAFRNIWRQHTGFS